MSPDGPDPDPTPPDDAARAASPLAGLLLGPMTRVERYNARVAVVGDMIWGFQAALAAGSTVLTVLLERLGATRETIGVVGAIEAGGMVLPQVVGAFLFRRGPHRKRRIITGHIALVAPFLWVMAGLTWFGAGLPSGVLQAGLLSAYALSVIGIGLIIPSWIDWTADIFSPSVRGRVLGMCLAGAAGTGVLGALLAGYFIKTDPRVEGYSRHFTLAGVGVFVSLLWFYRLRDPEDLGRPLPPPPDRRQMVAHFFESLRDANFRAFLVGRMLAILGFSILPFIAVHYTSAAGGALPGEFVVSCAAGQAVATSAAYYLFGRLGDTRGHRLGMIACAAMQVATLAVMLASPGPAGCVLAYAAAGLAIGSGGIAQFNLLLETCPHEGRVAHITAGNLAISAVTIAAPLLSGWIAQHWATPRLFTICMVFSALALVWFVLRLREPRRDGKTEKPEAQKTQGM